MSFVSPGFADFVRRARSAWLVLIGTLMVSAIAAQYVASTSSKAERIQYDNAIHNAEHEIVDSIGDRIGTHIGLLRGAAALFAADGTVTRRQFQDYVARLNLRKDYPGVLGIGFNLWVKPGEEDAVEEDMQDQGLGAFHIWPSPGGGEANAVVYLEPLDARNQLALGYNMGSEPVRRQAMERARDAALPAASGKVTLLQEKGQDAKQATGFLIYVPVYIGGKDPGTAALRQKNLAGFVFSPFQVADLLEGVGGARETSLLDFTVYDQDFAAASHLHHTGEVLSGPLPDGNRHRPEASTTLDVAGRTWRLAFRARPELTPVPSRALPLGVFGTGCAFALILFWVMSSQARSRAAAERAVAKLSQSEAALRQSQASLRRLVESNLIGVVISDNRGNAIEANNAFLSITGYTREDLVEGKLSRASITASEYAERDREAMDQVWRSGSHTPIEKQYVRKDGSRVPVLVGTTSVEGETPTTISFVVDLSELRKARGAVAESERRFRTLVEQSPLGIQVFAPDGHMLLANHAWEVIWESKLSDLQGYNVLEDPQFERMGLKPYLLQAFTGEPVVIPPFRYDPALSGRPGRPRWMHLYLYPVKDQAGQLRETVLIMQDVNEVKAAEEALQRSEEQLRLVIDALPALVSYIDLEKRFRLSNQLYEEWFDLPASEIDGKLLREIIGEEAYVIANPNLDRALTGERVTYERKMRFPDASIHDVQATLIPHVGLAGHVEGVVVLVVDITERKGAENERARLLNGEREARAEAETANRTKDEFLATLSHELRTPLNAILGWTQLLKMGGLPPDEISHGLDTVERNAKVQAQLVEDLLDLSRIISGKLRLDMRPVDLPGVLDAALDSVRPAAKAKGIQMVPLLDASASPVLGDAGRLQQVVWNLLSNAIKFTPPQGRVELLLQRVEDHAEILVSDTGIGIHPDFLPHVFERLRQADSSSTRRHGGLGLGLSIARHLIESHGGTIRVHSVGENRGATFIVSLPLSLNAQVSDGKSDLSDSDSDLNSDSGLVVRRQKLQGVRVLVVDDEADARDLVSRILRQDGAEVRAAKSAAEALGAIDEQSPDVLVSDIAMPGEDGYELIRKLRLRDSSHGGRLPAIALTALARNEDRERALKAGYHAHLPKPVQPIELSTAVAELARR